MSHVMEEPPANELTVEVSEETSTNIDTAPTNVVVMPSPRTVKKRKMMTSSPAVSEENDDDGSICSICLDSWELAGTHRLVSLKCGHLFGYSCIKRWIEDNEARNRLCPKCKKRTTQHDFRYIYPKKVTAIDNSEVVRLQEQLKREREKFIKLEMEHSLNLKFEQDKCTDLQERLSNLQQILASYNDVTPVSSLSVLSTEESE